MAAAASTSLPMGSVTANWLADMGEPKMIRSRQRKSVRALMRRALLSWKRRLESRLDALDAQSAPDPASARYCDAVDRDALLQNENLRAMVRKLAQRYPGRALIAYGSRIAGLCDAHSDLDVLVLEYDRRAVPVMEHAEVQGVPIDIARVGRDLLLKGIKGNARNNNNWFLSALSHCYIYGDGDGDARRLRAIAQDTWNRGPSPWTPRQTQASRAGLFRLLDSAKKLAARANGSPQAARLARMRCDQLVAHSIYQFYCVRGKWTTSFHHLIDQCQSDYPELYGLWLRYVACSSPDKALAAAELIVDAVPRGKLNPARAAQPAEGPQCVTAG